MKEAERILEASWQMIKEKLYDGRVISTNTAYTDQFIDNAIACAKRVREFEEYFERIERILETLRMVHDEIG